MRKKGQLLSMDFVFSLSIFLAILLISIVIWRNLNIQITQYEMHTDLENRILITSNLLIKTAGTPNDWENFDLATEQDKIISLGLAKRENVLNKTKILKFLDIDYDDTKTLLGIPRYEFCIEIADMTDTPIILDGEEIKCDLSADIANLYSIKRTVLLEEDDSREILFFNMMLWRSI